MPLISLTSHIIQNTSKTNNEITNLTKSLNLQHTSPKPIALAQARKVLSLRPSTLA